MVVKKTKETVIEAENTENVAEEETIQDEVKKNEKEPEVTEDEQEEAGEEEDPTVQTDDSADELGESKDNSNEAVLSRAKKKTSKKSKSFTVNEKELTESIPTMAEQSINELAGGNIGRKAIIKATREEKKVIYGQDETIFSDYDLTPKTDKMILREEYEFYARAALANPTMILKGIIDGVRETDNGMLIASVGNVVTATKNREKAPGNFFQVLIPVNQLFIFKKEDYSNATMLDELKAKMIARIGSKISFCIFQVEETTRIVFGSALMANHLRVRHFYIKKQKGSSLPALYPGLKAVAEINEVHLGRLHLDIGGAEATLVRKDISYNHLGPLTDAYKNGDTINVLIKEVKIIEYEAGNQKYELAKVTCSAKEAISSPAELYFDEFKKGGVYGGVITSEANMTHVYVTLRNKMDCLCKIPASKRAAVGEACTVLITHTDEDNKRLFGEIINI